MRISAFILFLFLILKSSIAMDLSLMFSGTCCSNDKIEMEAGSQDESNETKEGTKGCCDQDCDCVCCAQFIFESGDSDWQVEISNPHGNKPLPGSQSYKFLLHKMFWHPPRVNQ
jgi:hypothetical protein